MVFAPKMKGGSFHRARGKQFSFTLLTVICMTVLLWSYERRPHFATLLSPQDQFVLPSSDIFQVTSHISSDDFKQEYPVQEPLLVHAEPEDKPRPLIVNVADVESEPKESFVSSGTDEPSATQGSSFYVIMAFVFIMAVCNYAKGRWVIDNTRPLYSGFKCKQWLSEMWACRLTQRPDFGYEAYRWQPENCEMPEFERSAFLKRMQDRTIAFVGDSLGRQQFQSLMCMLTGGEASPEVQDVGREYGLTTPHGASRPNGWAFRFPATNTTVLYYWSSCLCDLVPLNGSDPKSEVAMHLDQPPSFLRQFLHRFDVLVLNTGHHWNRGKVRANRWIMYVDGKPNKNRRLAPVGNAKNFTIFSIARWVDSQLPSYPRLKVFFRTISPRHFFNGEWNTGGTCENTTPLARGSEVKQEGSSDQVIASAVRGTGVNLLDITALSQLRDEGHISRYSTKASSGIQDCLHWCLPGIPDTWNEILAAQV
ncbi:hypothetical protein Cgig2_022887 [Carnegiea gigantea]|uniref:Trichome birefringence-like N-terminal domain-containing protein n=1 Tax=Carnegiea gigantea TaxID=171969 RepID=A0A9Q1KPF4_9CARY|nr:hypothetical protein Cgig2_022887 [Carnegiea gigantea]